MIKKEEVPTLLIAEDDNSNFIYLQELLIDYKYKVIRAHNGAQAVEMCKEKNRIDMVFMDIKMPVMDGYEATRLIKQFRPHLPVIAQTAFAMSDDKEIALKNGCDDYMSKPIDPDVFFRTIEKYLLRKS